MKFYLAILQLPHNFVPNISLQNVHNGQGFNVISGKEIKVLSIVLHKNKQIHSL